MNASPSNSPISSELRRLAGQMIMTGFPKQPLGGCPEVIQRQLSDGTLGGILLFRYNIDSPEQHSKLIDELDELSLPERPFVALDQEGGMVQRISSKNGYRDHPSALKLADNHSVAEAQTIYADFAAMIAGAGFTFDFAPCVDLHSVNSLPPSPAIGKFERSYSSDPETVVRYARLMIEALRENKIASCLKHFPGHGSAQGDTHKDIIDITATWNEIELVPFQKLTESGHADAIMSAHVVHQTIDPETPGTLSKKWLSRLRNEMGFKGVIVSDDLHMGAIQKHFGLKETVIGAIEAGIDLMVFSNNALAAKGVEGFAPQTDLPEHVLGIISEAVQSGRLTLKRLEQSHERIVALKRARL